jgi:hypothetical protein
MIGRNFQSSDATTNRTALSRRYPKEGSSYVVHVSHAANHQTFSLHENTMCDRKEVNEGPDDA